MSFTKSDRKFRDKNKNTSGAKGMSACLSQTYVDAMADALSGKKPKEIAARVKTVPRTVENWQSRASGPSGAHLIRLMAEYDEVFERVMDLTGRISGPSLSPAQREAARRALAILAGD